MKKLILLSITLLLTIFSCQIREEIGLHFLNDCTGESSYLVKSGEWCLYANNKYPNDTILIQGHTEKYCDPGCGIMWYKTQINDTIFEKIYDVSAWIRYRRPIGVTGKISYSADIRYKRQYIIGEEAPDFRDVSSNSDRNEDLSGSPLATMVFREKRYWKKDEVYFN